MKYRKTRQTRRNFNDYQNKKPIQERKREAHAGGFRCSHCKAWVIINEYIGTANRNHCSVCLWSKHVDEQKGDRKAVCHGGMQPIALTCKHDGYGRQGELMLVHECAQCDKFSINRIARDDDENQLLAIFAASQTIDNLSKVMSEIGVDILDANDEILVRTQLFGK